MIPLLLFLAALPVNGVYAVLSEDTSRPKTSQTVLEYEKKFLTLDTSSFVPLQLAAPPEARKDERGNTMLNVTLAPQHVKTLEDFTRAHLDGRVAVVIGGKVITTHKVRAVITDGKALITRCTDDACQKLLLELVK